MQRWVETNRIGVLAYMLDITDPTTLNAQALIDALEKRVIQERPLVESDEESRIIRIVPRKILYGLPPSTLNLLARVVDRHDHKDDPLYPAHHEVPKTLSWLTDISSYRYFTKTTRLSRVSIWADHALLAQTSARRMVRLGRLLFGVPWHFMNREEEIEPKISSPLEVLRDPWTTTEDRCKAVDALCRSLHEGPRWVWMQLENYLYHRQFFWPLLVFENGASISLPVAVDVWYDEDARNDCRITGVNGIIDVDAWEQPLSRSVDVGKTLWRSKRGNFGSFRDWVMSSQTVVTFDFSYAEDIIQVLADTGSVQLPLALDDRSAEAYLAQAVLNRLIGQTNIQASAATGAIGEQYDDPRIPGQKLLDFSFDKPENVAAKLHYVFSSHLFERIALPADAEPDWEKYLARDDVAKQTASVKFVSNLAGLADVMQVRGWRQYQYVRCPDLTWAIHGPNRPGLIPEKYLKVREILRLLKTNRESVRTINASPTVVASALWHINDVLRYKDPENIPPSLSWAFIRVREEDTDMSFWHLIWDVLGAPYRDFENFYKDFNTEHAVQRLAEALNTFEPNYYRPSHRAPDVLVIVGTEHLQARLNETLTPSSHQFAVPVLLERLRDHLLSQERITDLIGHTRILIIPHEETELSPALIDADIYGAMNHPIRKLSIFRGGFTQHMADLMLDGVYKGKTLRTKVLDPLMHKGLLRRAAGMYHVPEEVKQRITFWNVTDKVGAGEQARLHFKAGAALAPYVTATRLPSLAADIAFSPEYLYEADYHYHQAYRLAGEAGELALRNDARHAIKHITLYLSIPWWGTVVRMLMTKDIPSPAYEVAAEVLHWEEDANDGRVHPKHLALAAWAAYKDSKARMESEPQVGSTLREKASNYFETALQQCEDIPDEEYSIKAFTLSHYTSFLSDESLEDALKAAEELRDLVETNAAEKDRLHVRYADAKALEMAGDQIKDHYEALHFYRAGMLVTPQWAELWVKGIGAAELSEDSSSAEVIRTEISTSQELQDLLSYASQYYRDEYRDTMTDEWVRRRLKIGIQQLTDRNILD